ncbi:MAG: amidohydrolase/deacetylase family metallohydrolase [Acidobacteria bacterium]|nr:amidohydrolase/deacetylase family metallohydrolase [Acidobacteriota bacterium]
MRRVAVCLLGLALGPATSAQQPAYDLLLKGGHVVDGRSSLSAIRDVAIKGRTIAAIAENIPAARAARTVDARGLYVAPGLIDIHVHVFTGEKTATYAGGDLSVWPDNYGLRTCTTTMVDAGSSGWRSFEDFKRRVIDRSKTRVLAFLNIVGVGMREGQLEQNVEDMDAQATADMAQKYKDLVVGIKSAHYNGPGWTPYERAEAAGRMANVPVMVDFGGNVRNGRSIMELFTKYFRPGDIYTHMYGGVRGEQDAATRGPSAAFIEGRKRGIVLDVGHGGGSFRWSAAVPMVEAGLLPDSISTDLHTSSSQSGMKDLLDVMSKFLALGLSVEDVLVRATWNPAREIKRDTLGHLSVGAPADVAVLRVEDGQFGFYDQVNARVAGTRRFACEITLRDGTAVWDANARAKDAFDPQAPLPAPGAGLSFPAASPAGSPATPPPAR